MTSKYRALLSVSDKSGLVEFAEGLVNIGYEIISTGGTAAALRSAGLTVTEVSEVTGFPEIMGGRVKTLHPSVHGAILARGGIDDEVAAKHQIEYIDLLAVNLYPFTETISRPDCSFEDAVENIDIGGPAMLRAAAKNHSRVTVVVDPSDYSDVLETLQNDRNSHPWRLGLATKAFAHTAAYDSAIAQYLSATQSERSFPKTLTINAQLAAEMRYGENPHQAAALYITNPTVPGAAATAKQLQGKALSYNNINDADAAVQCVRAFDNDACVIVKHANPCGVAQASSVKEAYELAYACDPVSAFGGIIAFNRTVDGETAQLIVDRQFAEVILAPEFETAALQAFGTKKNIRVLALGELGAATPALELRSVEHGLLAQERDIAELDPSSMRIVSKKQPSAEQLEDLKFAWTVAKYVKSNAIVYASNRRTLGVGAGQMSRVDSARIAALKAEEAKLSLQGAVMASDAFFPFRDAVEMAAERGIHAIIHPGGAMRDEEIIAAADEHEIVMVMTGIRHFRH